MEKKWNEYNRTYKKRFWSELAEKAIQTRIFCLFYESINLYNLHKKNIEKPFLLTEILHRCKIIIHDVYNKNIFLQKFGKHKFYENRRI